MADHDPGERVYSGEARRRVQELVANDGETFAEQAGIALRDEPGPLWQLLVLANLLSNRIRSDAALASAQELWKIGCTTPAATRATSWQQRVDALGRGGYRRYDFSTSTRLGANAVLVLDRWSDDLRALRDEAAELPGRRVTTKQRGGTEGVIASAHPLLTLLQQFDGIGPAGARIFLREVQGVWLDVGPVVDPLVQRGAVKAGLPDDPVALAELAAEVGADMPRVCAALVRLARQR